MNNINTMNAMILYNEYYEYNECYDIIKCTMNPMNAILLNNEL